MKIKVAVDGKFLQEQTYENWCEEVFEVTLQQLLSDSSIHNFSKRCVKVCLRKLKKV